MQNEETISQLCCERCQCTNVTSVKKGFSGQKAIIGFICGLIVSVVIMYAVIAMNYVSYLYISMGVLSLLPLLCLLYGTAEMNDIYSICLRCGNRILIYKSKERNIFAPDEAPAQLPEAD